MQIDLQIGNAVKEVGSAFYGSGINAIFYTKGFESSAGKNGLADDRVRPSDGIALGIEARGKTIVPHRPVPSASQIVFASPHDLDGSFGDLSDFDGFNDEIGRGIGATAETSAQKRGVELHFFGRQARSFGSVSAVNSFKLRACPDLTIVGAEVDDAIERLHHAV